MRRKNNKNQPLLEKISEDIAVFTAALLIVFLLFMLPEIIPKKSKEVKKIHNPVSDIKPSAIKTTDVKPKTTPPGIGGKISPGETPIDINKAAETKKTTPESIVPKAPEEKIIKPDTQKPVSKKENNNSEANRLPAPAKQTDSKPLPGKSAAKSTEPGTKASKSNNAAAKPSTKTSKSVTKLVKPNTSVPKAGGKATAPTKPSSKTPKQEEENEMVKRITRSEAYSRGMSIINYVWDYNYLKNGTKGIKGVALPNYLKGQKHISTTGIPYCWGGYLSIDKSNRPDVTSFQDAIKKGYTAGNIYCLGTYRENTAGLDCSGFVCAIYNIPDRYGTGMLYKYFKEIDRKDLKPMDILNCQAEHVIIYLRETDDKKGIITMEAAVNQYPESSDKTNINYRSWDTINKGLDGKPYVAMRYKGIVDSKVIPLRDGGEYNNIKAFAAPVNIGSKRIGYIDYADDVDYYRLQISEARNYTLKVGSLPKFCCISVLTDEGKTVLTINKNGSYKLNMVKQPYFIKAEGINYRFNTNQSYSFVLSKTIYTRPAKPSKHKRKKLSLNSMNIG